MPILKWDKYYILFLAHMFHLKRVRRGACQKNPQGAPRGGPKYHPDQFLCKNRICRGFRLFCQCQFWNETSIIYFSWLTCSIWRESEGVLVKKIPRGPPGGAQSSLGALRGKKFCLQKWGPNNSECFDLPRSTIIKITFLKKWNFSSRSIFMQK